MTGRLYRALAYRRRYVAHRHALGALMIRTHRITGRTDQFIRLGDDVIWLYVPPRAHGLVQGCDTRSKIEQLISAPSARRHTGVDRADRRPGAVVGEGWATVPGSAPGHPARRSLPRAAGRARGGVA